MDNMSARKNIWFYLGYTLFRVLWLVVGGTLSRLILINCWWVLNKTFMKNFDLIRRFWGSVSSMKSRGKESKERNPKKEPVNKELKCTDTT